MTLEANLSQDVQATKELSLSRDRYVQDRTEHTAQSAYHLLNRADVSANHKCAEEKQNSIQESKDAVSLSWHQQINTFHVGQVSVSMCTPNAAQADLVAASGLEPCAARNLVISLTILHNLVAQRSCQKCIKYHHPSKGLTLGCFWWLCSSILQIRYDYIERQL